MGRSETQHVPVELRDFRNAHELHVSLDLRPHIAERLFDPWLSGGGERVEIHTPARARLGPSGQCLENMGAAPNPAVQDHIDLVAHCVNNFRKLIEGTAGAV